MNIQVVTLLSFGSEHNEIAKGTFTYLHVYFNSIHQYAYMYIVSHSCLLGDPSCAFLFILLMHYYEITQIVD